MNRPPSAAARPTTHSAAHSATRPAARPAARAAAWAAGALAAASGSLFSAGPAPAQTMLYPDRLPDGFAYVRFVNTLPEAVTVKPVGFGEPVTLGTEAGARVSPYRVVEGVAGRRLEADAASGGREARGGFAVEPGSFDTVLVGAGGSLVRVVDQAEVSQTRARLAFYNAAPGCAAAGLQLDPGGRAVFAGVAPATMRGRSVNPAEGVHLRATCPSGPPVALDAGDLGAGGQYSVWLMAPGGTATTFLSVNAIAPFLR